MFHSPFNWMTPTSAYAIFSVFVVYLVYSLWKNCKTTDCERWSALGKPIRYCRPPSPPPTQLYTCAVSAPGCRSNMPQTDNDRRHDCGGTFWDSTAKICNRNLHKSMRRQSPAFRKRLASPSTRREKEFALIVFISAKMCQNKFAITSLHEYMTGSVR